MIKSIKSALRNSYLSIVIGTPETTSQTEKHNCFLQEFAHRPEAEQLRIRWRIWSFIFVILPMVAEAVSNSILVRSGQNTGALGNGWPTQLSLILALIMPNCDYSFARTVMKQRDAASQQSHSRVAEFLLQFFLPPAQSESAIGDLNEGFAKRRQIWNLRYAQIWYWWHTIRSLSTIFDALIEQFVKWGIVGAIAAWIRRYL